MSWSTALKRFHSLRGDDRLAGFYKTRNPMHNKYFYLLVTPHTHTHYKIARFVFRGTHLRFYMTLYISTKVLNTGSDNPLPISFAFVLI